MIMLAGGKHTETYAQRAEESALPFSKTGKLSVKENVEKPYFTGNNLDLEGDIWYHCDEIIPCCRNPIHILENSHSRAPQPAMFAA